jgi:hypothetical protein
VHMAQPAMQEDAHKEVNRLSHPADPLTLPVGQLAHSQAIRRDFAQSDLSDIVESPRAVPQYERAFDDTMEADELDELEDFQWRHDPRSRHIGYGQHTWTPEQEREIFAQLRAELAAEGLQVSHSTASGGLATSTTGMSQRIPQLRHQGNFHNPQRSPHPNEGDVSENSGPGTSFATDISDQEASAATSPVNEAPSNHMHQVANVPRGNNVPSNLFPSSHQNSNITRSHSADPVARLVSDLNTYTHFWLSSYYH